GPTWFRVSASWFRKMLLNSAVGWEKPGAPAGGVAWNSGSFASEPRPAACGTPMAEFSDEAVLTLLATELLMIRALAASSSVMAPPRSGAPLSANILFRVFTGSVE